MFCLAVLSLHVQYLAGWCLDECQTYCLQIVDANILKQYIFQKGFITESAKLKREQEAASSTLQVTLADHTTLSCLPYLAV